MGSINNWTTSGTKVNFNYDLSVSTIYRIESRSINNSSAISERIQV